MLGSSIVVTLLSFIISLISFINQLVIANIFGATILMDAYIVAVSIPLLVSAVIVGFVNYSLVPFLIKYKEDANQYGNVSTLILMALVFISLLLIVVGFLTTPLFMTTFGKTFPAEVRDEAIAIYRISWITVSFMLVGGHLAAIHNASKRFALPVIASAFPYIMMIVFCLNYGQAWGPISITLGMLVGFIGSVILLSKRALMDMKLTKEYSRLWKDVATFFTQAPLVIPAMLCFTAYQTIDAYWAPRIGSGNLAHLGYCQRLLVAMGNLVIVGPSVVLVPHLAEAFNEGRHEDFLRDIGRAVRMVVSLAAPLAISVSILSTPLVELLFQRGAFDIHATQGVAALLPFMMLGMVAMLSVVLLFRALFAKGSILSSSVLGIAATTIYFVLSGLFSTYWGAMGIAAAYAITWWIILILAIYVIWRGRAELIYSKENVTFIVHLIISLVVVSIVVFCGKILTIDVVQNAGYLEKMFRVSLVSVTAMIVFYIMAVKLFRIEDINYIFEFLFRKVVNAWKRI